MDKIKEFLKNFTFDKLLELLTDTYVIIFLFMFIILIVIFILTCLGWIPGIIGALIILNKNE